MSDLLFSKPELLVCYKIKNLKVRLFDWVEHNVMQVWYEWCVTSPWPSPIHNSNGRSYWVGL